MPQYLIVLLLALGITFIVNAYIIIKTTPDRLKKFWANCFFFGGMIIFFFGMSEATVRLIEYLFKLAKVIVALIKFKP